MKKLNTKNCCFLCLQSNKIKIEDHNENSETTFHSVRQNQSLLRCLIRHLQINLNGLETVPSNSTISNQDNTDVEVDLCEDCAQLNRKFSKLFLQLEKVQMEMNFYLKGIHHRILESSKNLELVQNYSMEMTSDRETLTQLAFVDKLRKEIADKSSRQECNPRVYLTRTELTAVKTFKQEPEEIESFDDTGHFEDHNPGGCTPTVADSPEQPDTDFSSVLKPEVTPKAKKRTRIPRKKDSKNFYTRNLSTREYHCTICPNTYKTLHGVRFHNETTHQKKIGKCDGCNMSFTQVGLLEAHKKICKATTPSLASLNIEYFVRNPKTKKLVCTACEKPFKEHAKLKRHYECVHLGVKPYKCDICNVAKFTNERCLRKHKIICTGVPPVKIEKRNVYFTQDEVTKIYQCTKCEKKSNHMVTIVLHYENIHLQKRYKCDICNLQEFTLPRSLKKHKKICRETLEDRLRRKKEAEQFAYKCKLCGKRFQTAYILNGHRLAVHVNANRFPFECDLCGKKVKYKSTLKLHRDVVHFGKRFECRFCRKNWSYKYLQISHERDCPRKNEVKIESSVNNDVRV